MPHRQDLEEDYIFEVSGPNEYIKGYSVSLPHQCDDFEILGADMCFNKETEEFSDDSPNLPIKKEMAVKQMELFVQRAQEALEKLKLL